MGPSSSFVEYHEFLDVLLQSFLSFKQQAECHVKERARRYFRRRIGDGEAEIYEFGDGEAETYEFGVAPLLSSHDLRDFNNPVNAKAEQGGVSTSVWKQMRDRSPNPAMHSQARQQDTEMQIPGNRKRSDSSDSPSAWKHMRGVETRMNRSKMAFRNVQISNHQYLGKVFQHSQNNLGTTENSSQSGIEAVKTTVLMWNCSRHRQWKQPSTNYNENLGVFKNTNFRGNLSFFLYHSEVDIGAL